MTDRKRTAKKAARLMLLLHLETAGVLNNLSQAAIGRVTGVNRSTIHRDFQDLPMVKAEYRRLMKTQPWVPRAITVAEFADRIGASPETVRGMIRDGLVRASKMPGPGRGGQWYILVSELDWWLRPRNWKQNRDPDGDLSGMSGRS